MNRDDRTSIDGRGVSPGNLLVGLGILALGAYFTYGAFSIEVATSYSRVGPRVFPFLVAAGLLVCGALLVVQALRGQEIASEAGEDVDLSVPPDYFAVGGVVVTLVVYVLLLEPLGFALASAVLFWGVAFAFGSRHYGRDIAVGLILSFTAYLAFSRLLGLTLPAGVLEPLGL